MVVVVVVVVVVRVVEDHKPKHCTAAPPQSSDSVALNLLKIQTL